jgi:hypothetical protein
MKTTILPPKPDDYDEGYRLPYTNEFILLSFEGHLKPFEAPPTKYGKRPSYAPGAPRAPGEKTRDTQRDPGFFEYWKSKLTILYG